MAASVLLMGSLAAAVACSDAPAPSALDSSVPSFSLGLAGGATADTLPVGGTVQLTAPAASGPKRQRQISWTSRNTSVASVSSTGLVTARAVGSAMVVSLRNGTPTDSARIVVASTSTTSPVQTPAPVATVTVTAASTSLTVGQTTQLTVTLKDSTGTVLTNRTVTWSASNTAVGTVSASGLVTAVAGGSTAITATSENRTGTVTINVAAPVPTSGGVCSLVSDLSSHPASAMSKPGYLQSGIDPEFRTTITRISGDPGSSVPTVGGTWGTIVRQHYSKDAAWSADQALIALSNTGTGRYYFLDGNTYSVLYSRSAPGPEARWHPTLPDVMLYVTSGGTVGQWNVRTGSVTPRVSVSGYSNAELGPFEGNPSKDGRLIAVSATRSSDGRAVVWVADVDGGSKGPDLDVASVGVTDLDWASVSASGRYLVLHGIISGVEENTVVYERRSDGSLALVTNFNQYGRPFHYDLTTDDTGAEVAVGGVGGSPDSKMLIKRRLVDGVATVLGTSSYDAHTSTRNTQRAGWAYTAINNANGPYDKEIYALRLDGSGAVERYAHHRATGATYDRHAFAVPSPDGRRVIFASDWGDSSGPVQTYVADARPLCK